MKPVFFPLVLLAAVTALAGCNPATDFTTEERAAYANSVRATEAAVSVQTDTEVRQRGASCPCFSRGSLSNTDRMLASEADGASDYYLFFDVFNYYGLDARRTEARALVSTPDGPLEEVATVYITSGSEDELFLICHRQEVVQHPISGESSYRYETLAPTVEEAEACRRDLNAVVASQEPCQGPACGIEYSKEQLDPNYPPYHDGNFRTPASLLDTMRERVAAVEQLLQLPA